jgi:O-antigen/teichoic acid export membrane protein
MGRLYVIANEPDGAMAAPYRNVAAILVLHEQQIRPITLIRQRENVLDEIRLVEAHGDDKSERGLPEGKRGLHFGHVELEEGKAHRRLGHERQFALAFRALQSAIVAPHGRTMIRRALTNTGWLMGARGINAVLSLGYLALATRALGLDGFGQFILVVSFAQALTGLASFQTWQAVVRWGHRPETAPDAVGFAVGLDLLTITVGTGAAALLLALGGGWLPVAPDLRLDAFLLTAVCLLTVRSTPTGILRLHDRYARAAAADSVTSIVRILGAALAFVLMPTIQAFLLIWAVAEVATAAAYWAYAWRLERLQISRISLRRLPHGEPGAWGFVWGTGLSGMLMIGSRQILVLIVGALGGAAMAGVYRVAAQLGEGLLKLAQALLRATYPELVRDPAQARHIAGRIARLALVTGLASLALGAVAGQWLIEAIAGPSYLGAYGPMLLLAAAAAIELAGASLEALLVSRGHALRNFLLRAVPTLLALAALPFAVGRAGALGAATVVLAASGLTVAGLYFVNREKTTNSW